MEDPSSHPNSPPAGSDDREWLAHLVRDLFPVRTRDRRSERSRRQSPSVPKIWTETDEERDAAAVATLLLAAVHGRGGTAVHGEALHRLADRALAGLPGEARAAALEEVVSTLDWLAHHLARTPGGGGRDREQESHDRFEGDEWTALLAQAIDGGTDIVLDYWSFQRGELSRRRITPAALDGEWLVGHCHLRGAERRFRLARIRHAEAAPAELQGEEPT